MFLLMMGVIDQQTIELANSFYQGKTKSQGCFVFLFPGKTLENVFFAQGGCL